MSTLRLLVLFLSLISILTYTTSIYAKEAPFLKESELKEVNITKYEEINPNLLIYPFKRMGENIKLFLIFDKEKQDDYFLSLLETRFKELVYIINFNKTGFIAFSVDRYNTFIGQIKNRNIKLDKDKIQKYSKVLEKLRDRYHSSSAPWEKIQQAIDTTKTLI